MLVVSNAASHQMSLLFIHTSMKPTLLPQKLNDKHSWREGGQNSYEVFELNKAYEVSDEYKEILFDGETK